jgi:outer membrane protein assembly factor BamB
MKRVAVALLALSAFALCAAGSDEPDWTNHRGNAAHDNYREVENRVRFPKVRWSNLDVWLNPLFAGDSLYVGGRRLLRLDPDSGRVLSAALDRREKDDYVWLGAVGKKRVIAATMDGAVRGLTRDLSRVVWTRKEKAATFWACGIWGVLAGGLYVYGEGDSVVAIREEAGEVAWRRDLGDDRLEFYRPAVADGRVFLGTTGGRVMALALTDGKTIWEDRGTEDVKRSQPLVAFGRLFVTDFSGRIRAFDPQTGKVLWSNLFEGSGADPSRTENAVAVGHWDKVTLFDPESGEALESPRIVSDFNPCCPTQVGSTLCHACLDGTLRVHDMESGKLLWKLRVVLPTVADGPPKKYAPQVNEFVYRDGRFYVSTTEGLVVIGNDPDGKPAPEGTVIEWRPGE